MIVSVSEKTNGWKRVLIANRGEIAVRAIRACRDLGLATLSVYSHADRGASHSWLADDCVCIGPAASSKSYLNGNALIHAALAKGCDAIYPGYGFLSENATFAERVADAVPLMEKTLLDHLKTIGIDAVKKAEVDIQAILPNSFKALDAYSV